MEAATECYVRNLDLLALLKLSPSEIFQNRRNQMQVQHCFSYINVSLRDYQLQF